MVKIYINLLVAMYTYLAVVRELIDYILHTIKLHVKVQKCLVVSTLHDCRYKGGDSYDNMVYLYPALSNYLLGVFSLHSDPDQ